MGIATQRLLQLADAYDETRPLMAVYAELKKDRGEMMEEKIDQLERTCVRLMETLDKCRLMPPNVKVSSGVLDAEKCAASSPSAAP